MHAHERHAPLGALAARLPAARVLCVEAVGSWQQNMKLQTPLPCVTCALCTVRQPRLAHIRGDLCVLNTRHLRVPSHVCDPWRLHSLRQLCSAWCAGCCHLLSNCLSSKLRGWYASLCWCHQLVGNCAVSMPVPSHNQRRPTCTQPQGQRPP
jgi:hypothetical protein